MYTGNFHGLLFKHSDSMNSYFSLKNQCKNYAILCIPQCWMKSSEIRCLTKEEAEICTSCLDVCAMAGT